MAPKAKKGLKSLSEVKDDFTTPVETFDFSDVDWGFEVPKKVDDKLTYAVISRDEAFKLIEAANRDEPRIGGLIAEIKILKAKEKNLNDDVNRAVHAAWTTFAREQPVRNIVIKTDKEQYALVKERIDEKINSSKAVMVRNENARQIDAIQKEIDEIRALRHEAYRLFDEADMLARECGYEPSDLGWGKKEKDAE